MNVKRTHGFEATVRFGATIATAKETQAIDVKADDTVPLWRISATTNRTGIQQLLGRLIYGTGSSIEIDNILCPLVAYVPGNVALYLQPQTNPFVLATLKGYVSVRPVCAPGEQVIRSLADAGGGAVFLPTSAVAYTAYTASTLTISGIGAIPVAAAARIRIAGPARLTAGSGIVEHQT